MSPLIATAPSALTGTAHISDIFAFICLCFITVSAVQHCRRKGGTACNIEPVNGDSQHDIHPFIHRRRLNQTARKYEPFYRTRSCISRYKANQEEAARLNKLCEDINALPLNDEPMDRKRAQESLDTVLTGENYATLMHKSDKEESPCAGFIPADVLLRAELSIKEAVSFIGDVRDYNSSRDIVLQALINMFTDKAGDASPCRGDGINPTDSTAPLFAYYRDELKANVTSFHYSVSGLETALIFLYKPDH